jgi:hypothetical protein
MSAWKADALPLGDSRVFLGAAPWFHWRKHAQIIQVERLVVKKWWHLTLCNFSHLSLDKSLPSLVFFARFNILLV